jgi:hypothetical protein
VGEAGFCDEDRFSALGFGVLPTFNFYIFRC